MAFNVIYPDNTDNDHNLQDIETAGDTDQAIRRTGTEKKQF